MTAGARHSERGDLRRRERETQELHRGGLALGAGVFAGRVGLAADPLAADLDERAVSRCRRAAPVRGRGGRDRRSRT